MATTTTMHFGPEWMRTKQPSSRTHPPPSPPPAVIAPSGASTYSALVSPATAVQPEKRDETHPFRYSKEDLLRIYKEGSGRGGLGLEVERWEGVVREVGSEPVALREMSEAEKKLFAGSLNSDLRRRQSNDLLSSLSTTSHGGERHRSHRDSPVAGSPLRERFGSLMRRRDSADQPSLTIPRKLSSSGPAPILTPRDNGQPSPRPRIGFASTFDGVLNGGESWVARRRTSEGYLRGNTRTEVPVADTQNDGQGSEIKEEDEKEKQAELDEPGGTGLSPAPPLSQSSSFQGQLKEEPEPQLVTTTINDPSSMDGAHSISSSRNPGRGAGQSTVNPDNNDPDIASIEWSYLDPQGQVQGPFRADLMQKWYDEGYFTPELLMRRTNIDLDWIAVAELNHRAGGNKIFLSQQIAPAPPGLSRRSNSSPPSPGPALPTEQTSEPYQPAPVRSLRTSALESYIGSGSNPSDSPTSSLGGGVLANGSPDITSRGMPATHSYSSIDTNFAPRVTGFTPVSDSAAFAGARRNTYHDPALDPSIPLRHSYGNVPPGRSSTMDSHSFNSTYSSSPSSNWSSSSNAIGSQFEGIPAIGTTDMGPFSSSLGSSPSSGPSLVPQNAYAGRGGQDAFFVETNTGILSNTEYATGDFGHQQDTQFLVRPTDDSEMPMKLGFNEFANGPFANSSPAQQYGTPAPTQYPVPPQTQPSQHLPTRYIQSLNAIAPAPQSAISPVRSPWITQDPAAARRPDPFGPLHPTSINTVPARPATPPQGAWNRPNQTTLPTTSLPSNPSPWFIASQGVLDEGWKDAAGPNSLTFKNVDQHNQIQQQLLTPIESQVDAQNITDHSPQPTAPESASQPVSTSTNAPAPGPGKSRRKSTAHMQVLATKPPLGPIPLMKSPSSPSVPTAPTKAAWLNEDETKNKPVHATLSLRDIQEAEAKKNEARKAAERERERQSRVPATPAAVEDLQPFTTTWGLPTSQAGAARNNIPLKDASGVVASASAPSTSAVWTNNGKTTPAKKTMKEIQEEERKKSSVKETVAAAAAKRVYSDTIAKPTPLPLTGGGAWTTVGSSGKTPTAVITPSRPSPSSVPIASAPPSSATRTNGMTSSRPPAALVAPKPAPTPSKSEEPVPPSHDFLKWLTDSLKGLNSSVNVEEIISMLLSFPMDPDSSTVEIISDLIYANSTTLDGRRFAAEFVSKRKVDAASRQQGAGGAGSTKPISIADVVKAQPKPTQPEWGGFKVVNKKKKGGRS